MTVILARIRKNPDFWFSLAVVALTIVPLLLAPVRARFLGPEGRGLFAIFQADLTTSAAVGMLGARLASYSIDIGNRPRHNINLSGLALVGTLAYVMAALPLGLLASSRGSSMVCIGLLAGILLAPGWIVGQTELARAQLAGRRRWILAVTGGPGIIEFVGNLGLALLRSLSVLGSVVITLCAEAYRSIASLWRYGCQRREHNPSAPEHSAAGRAGNGRVLMRRSLSLAPAAILPMLAVSVDIILFSLQLPASVLGIYAVARLGSTILYPLAGALEGRLLRHAVNGGLGRGILRSCLDALPVATVIGVTGALLITPVFGGRFASAAVPFAVAAFGGVIRFGFGCASALAAQLGRSGALNVAVTVMVGVEALACLLVAYAVGPSVISMVVAVLLSQGCGLSVLYLLVRGAQDS